MITIEELSISSAWFRAFKQASENRGTTKPMSVTFSQLSDINSLNTAIQKYLNNRLSSQKMPSIETVANTIFPLNLWNSSQSRTQLFNLYDLAWPRINACKNNRKGTYFRRMTKFGNDHKSVNQLDHIIKFWEQNGRRNSAFQMSIFSPLEDHTRSPYGAFPCLHQVSVTPHGTNGVDGISITGYYATQHIYNKAFGNYLGLYNLGKFIAHEMELEMNSVTCIAANPQIGTEKNRQLPVTDQIKIISDINSLII